MPASPSTSRNRSDRAPPARRRSYAALLAIGVVVAFGGVLFSLPASLITHFLPKEVQAEELSGSIWHGSAGKLIIVGRDAGALEWRLSPLPLLHFTTAADVHWVKLAVVGDASLSVAPNEISAQNVHGGGPLQDLIDFGLPDGLRGTAVVALSEVRSQGSRLTRIVGDLSLSGLSVRQVGDGAELGNYALHFDPDAVASDGTITGRLIDDGGPLQVQGTVALSPAAGTGMVSGTVKERAGLPAALANQIQSIAQLRGRDAQGRIPVDLEFSF